MMGRNIEIIKLLLGLGLILPAMIWGQSRHQGISSASHTTETLIYGVTSTVNEGASFFLKHAESVSQFLSSQEEEYRSSVRIVRRDAMAYLKGETASPLLEATIEKLEKMSLKQNSDAALWTFDDWAEGIYQFGLQ